MYCTICNISNECTPIFATRDRTTLAHEWMSFTRPLLKIFFSGSTLKKFKKRAARFKTLKIIRYDYNCEVYIVDSCKIVFSDSRGSPEPLILSERLKLPTHNKKQPFCYWVSLHGTHIDHPRVVQVFTVKNRAEFLFEYKKSVCKQRSVFILFI